MSKAVFYWKGAGNQRNFGDSLAQLLLDELFAAVPVKAKRIFIVGSCIDDLFFSEPHAAPPGSIEDRLVFWGCGLRTPSGLSEKNRHRCEILAVRGPLSRSALRLGESVPIGDPALLLPALYQPAPDAARAGRTVCVPHFHDPRSDAELLDQSGCDAILRPNIPESKQSVRSLIDQIAAADFVLSAALHGAIVAAAYGRPFAYWENGHLDLPFKWADFAASACIPNRFARTLPEGRKLYAETIAPAIRLPSPWPLVASAPLAIRPDALLKVLRFDLRVRGLEAGAPGLDGRISEFIEHQQVVGELSGHRRPSEARDGDWAALATAAILEDFEKAVAHGKHLERLSMEQHTELERLSREALAAAVRNGEREAELERLRREADAHAAKDAGRAADLKRKDAEIEALTEAGVTQNRRIAELEKALADQALGQGARIAELQAALANRRRGGLASWFRRGSVRLPFSKIRVPLRLGTLRALLRLRSRDALLLANSPLLDEAWYARQNPDVAAAGVHPLVHYLSDGAYEGRDPSPAFDSDYYLSRNPDVAASRENPLCHYLRHGHHEGRLPNPSFDPRWYLSRYPDVKAAGLEPLTHYLLHGAAEGREPYAGFKGSSGSQPPADPQPRRPAPPVALAPKQAPPPPLPGAVANRQGPRVLVVDSVYPRPDRDSGSVTARYLIEILLQFGWQVTFFADAELGDADGYARQLEDLGVRCLRQPAAGSLESFLQAEGATLSLCLLFRVFSGGRHYESVRRHCPDARIVFETVDLHFLREERRAILHDDRRALNLARGTRERELYLARSSDLAVVVSGFERDLLEREVPGVRAMTLPLILECPGRTAPFASRSGVCFIGGYLHQPNIDAVRYFLDQIWPLVLERAPRCVFHIVGADMPDEFKARASSSVVPVGYVKDLDGFLGKMRLTVAPLRYGAGVKGKVGSSLANGVPCVGTSIAAEGMGLETGKAIAVADDPRDFADQIVALHEDSAVWTRMSDAGFRYASEQFSLAAARQRVADMLRSLGLPAPRLGKPAEMKTEAV